VINIGWDEYYLISSALLHGQKLGVWTRQAAAAAKLVLRRFDYSWDSTEPDYAADTTPMPITVPDLKTINWALTHEQFPEWLSGEAVTTTGLRNASDRHTLKEILPATIKKIQKALPVEKKPEDPTKHGRFKLDWREGGEDPVPDDPTPSDRFSMLELDEALKRSRAKLTKTNLQQLIREVLANILGE